MAGRQKGLITLQQALQAGLTRRIVQRRLERGDWVAAHPGVYRVAGASITWEQRQLAACLAAGAVASHRAAARLWELDVPETDAVEITTDRTGGRALRGVRVHHTRELGRADTATRIGIPCTSAARTIVDLAGVLEGDDLDAAFDAALRKGHVSLAHLERHLHRLGRGRVGLGVLRDLVADRREHGPYGSRREAKLARLLVAAGVPAPARQYELWVDGQLVARFDLAWRAVRVAVEFQSYRHHLGRQAWRRDAARANRATAAGWRVLTATEHDVQEAAHTPAAVIARAHAA